MPTRRRRPIDPPLPKVTRPKTLTLMAHDPGTTSYGWAVLRVTKVNSENKIKVKILVNGMCDKVVKVLKTGSVLRSSLRQYDKWVKDIVDQYGVQMVIAERFMTRGGKGPTIESINMMLGVLLNRELPCKVIPASQWKNAATRAGVQLKDWYSLAKVTPHQLDACLIGVYLGSFAYGHKGFDALDLKAVFKSLVLQAEATSKERLIDRIKRRSKKGAA